MKKYINKFGLILLLVSVIFFLSSCKKKEYTHYTLTLDESFNTINKVDIFTLEKKSKEELDVVWEGLNNILIDLDNIFNIQSDRKTGEETDLMKINKNAGIKPVEVNEEVIYVLKEAISMSERSLINNVALFDPTIAPIWELWDFVNKQYNPILDNKTDAIPTKEQIQQLLPLVNYKKIHIDEENNTVFLEDPGMEIDLGSIVKGYAADKLKTYLLSQGYNKAVIDVGRNILAVGSYYTKELVDQPWTVRIQTPFVSEFDSNYAEVGFYGTLSVSDVTVVTSGVYEKYIMDLEGNKYHHILDPRTGYPFDNNVLSVTVVTTESIAGDGFSTTLFSLGLEDGMKIVNGLNNLEAIWVVQNGVTKEVYYSSGLKDIFTFNENVEALGYVNKGVYK